MIFNGLEVVFTDGIERAYEEYYAYYKIAAESDLNAYRVEVTFDGDFADLTYTRYREPIERVVRIKNFEKKPAMVPIDYLNPSRIRTDGCPT